MTLVVNTRAAHQAEALNKQLQAAGFSTVNFPTLIISDFNKSETKQICANLSRFNIAIFTSANAVSASFSYWPRPFSIETVIAVGPATKAALIKRGLSNVILPKEYHSEGILALAEIQQSRNASVIIFCGKNPRPLLFEKLTEQGATVTRCECYQRHCPAMDADALAALEKQQPDIIVSTSLENLTNLTTLIEQSILKKQPLVVINEKMAAAAAKQGWQNVLLSSDATNNAIVETIKRYTAGSQ